MKKITLDKNIRPFEHDIVKIKKMGYITELMYSQHRNTSCKIKKLDSEKYLILDTGEILNFEHIENRSDDKNSIRVSLGKLRDYLNTNISDVRKCRWCTFTYAENMTDTLRLYKDFEKVIKRLRYKYGHFEYIVAMEPQGRGAWHCHIVMIFSDIAPYIPNSLLADIWGHGFVTIKKLDDIDNIGAYLTAYLGDMDLEDALKDGINVNGYQVKEICLVDEKKSKYYLKGGRLCMYPPNFNLYRCSRGIKKPVIEYMTSKIADKKISADTLTFERTISLSDEQTGFDNIINYRYYNSKRDKNQ